MKNSFFRFCNIWRPDIFQGINKKANYFEGWFYKIVDSQCKEIIAIIPGLFLGKNKNDSKAFIQVFRGNKNTLDFFEYPVDQFNASRKSFQISIGRSEFSDQHLKLELQNEKINISGSLYFNQLKPWPKSFFSPGAMGPYSFIPIMQCNHSVISMDHHIQGTLKIDGKTISFNEGRGYIEKDWGTAFPSAYVWMQCNHFNNKPVSIFASISKIPWITGSFRGFIIGLLYEEIIYRFATYTGAKLEFLKIEKEYVEFQVKDRSHKLNVKAKRTDGIDLHAPYDMQFSQRASESLSSQIEVKFWEISGKKETLIFDKKGEPAALDINGKLEEINDFEFADTKGL